MNSSDSKPQSEISGESKVVILGGAGFIGTRLAALISERGIPFRVGDLSVSPKFPENSYICDVRIPESVGKLCRSGDVIINLAAEHRDDVHPISRYYEVNVDGARAVCAAARREGIKKIIFTSSVAVYGFQSEPVNESGPFAPFNEYGKTKFEAEATYRTWVEEDPSRTLVIVRPTVVFGEGNRGNVYNLFRQIASGRFLMTGSGQNVKSIAYVGNVASFLAHALSFGPGQHTFNYTDGPDICVKDLVEHAKMHLGMRGKTPRIPLPLALAGGHIFDIAGRVTGRTFPISAIRVRKFCANTQFIANRIKETGFVPPYSLAEALTRTLQFDFPKR